MFAVKRGVELSERSDQRERSAATAPGSRLSHFAEFTCDKVLRGVLTKKYGYVLQCEEDWRFPAPCAACHKFAALLSLAKFKLKLCFTSFSGHVSRAHKLLFVRHMGVDRYVRTYVV